jgi:hypothetical protein
MPEEINLIFETTQKHIDTYDLELHKSTIYEEEHIVEFSRQKPNGWWKNDYYAINSVVEFINSKISETRISIILN